MTRIALALEYDGGAYKGWQHQPHAPSVQAVVETALSRVADHPVTVVCAGRTDAGVHATGQVVHFDTHAPRPGHAWVLGTNANMPADVRVIGAWPVAADFHARFSARSRSYRYVILNRGVPSGLLRDRVCWERRALDAAAMAAGARALLGEHDFSSFRAVACQARHAVRAVTQLEVTRRGECVMIDVTANGFLHHMVRNIAGVLMAVGCGERPPAWVGEVLAARDRTVGGVTAPAAGLYLVGVGYPEEHGLPARGWLPVFQ